MELKQFLIGLLIITITVVKAITIPDNVYINNLHRQLEIGTPIIREHVAISIKSKDNNVDKVYLSYKNELVKHMSSILVFTKNNDKEEILSIKGDIYDEEKKIQYYEVKLPKPLKIEERVIINVEASFSKLQKPYPKYIAQTEDQYVLFNTNVYYLSPYQVLKQKTSFKVGSKIKSYTENPSPVFKEKDDIFYGPYENVEIGKEEIVSIHYMLNENFMHFEKLERTIEISHWGYNIAVNEDMIVHHDGAILKNNFNRIEYQRSKYYSEAPSSVKDMIFILPPKAQDIYFVDVIGNVSTSAIHKDEVKTLLQVLPRYPLFGGWKYTWSQGYNNPLGDNTKYDSKTGKYILQIPTLLSLKDVPIDNFKLKVILPEGAKNIDIHLPYSFDNEERKITYSYLDTTGRPTVILEKNNICDNHFQYFQVSYKMPFYFVLQKPIVVSLFYFSIFLVSMVWTRLDLRIVKDPNSDRLDLAVAYWESVNSVMSNGKKILEKFISANESYIFSQNEELYKDSCQNILRNVNETTESLDDIKKQLEEIEQNELSQKVKSLKNYYQEKHHLIESSYNEIISLNKKIRNLNNGNSEEIEKLKESIKEKTNELGVSCAEIDKEITLILNTQIL